ncbi:hypothetical protein HRI_001560100 [Hibiscus trionum]|uniref:Bet v I/Major latex protein domain-containing protein n=1 Tax=Hibiscus trionum TaxID=183268 RepID=A0A9W7HLB9_HIBTR|nr:hypothetical protein HRI_001560100 [Hibiscus trionum]
MHAHIPQDTAVGIPATVVWDLYGGAKLGRLVDKLLADVIGKVEIVEGDGGVGTIIKLTFPPGGQMTGDMVEIIAKVDDENRVRENEVIEGGFKDLGFDLFRFRLEIIEKDSESCIIRSSMEYEIDDELEDVVSRYVSIRPLKIIAETAGKHENHYHVKLFNQ